VRPLDAEVHRRDEGRARHPWRASAAHGRRTAQRTREGIGKIGRITPGSPNTITEFPIPSGQGAEGITVGPDGNIWFAEQFVGGNDGGDKIGRITTGSPNTITEFTIPTANGSPGDITTGLTGTCGSQR
jgi:hypothetical protein